MKFSKLAIVAVGLSCLLQAGCSDKQKIGELENANKSLRAEVQSLRSRLEESSKQMADARQELERAKAQASAQQTEVTRLQTQNQEAQATVAAAPTPAPAKIPVAHEEFKSAVMGKTSDQLTDYIGQPQSTSTDGSRQYWDYDAVTYDPVTGRPDRRVQVLFKGGRVDGVIFIP